MDPHVGPCPEVCERNPDLLIIQVAIPTGALFPECNEPRHVGLLVVCLKLSPPLSLQSRDTGRHSGFTRLYRSEVLIGEVARGRRVLGAFMLVAYHPIHVEQRS